MSDVGSRTSALMAVRTTCYDVAYAPESVIMPTSTRHRRASPRSSTVRSRAARPAARASRAGKVRKSFWLDPRLLEEARESLGASSEREAVEMALDLVGFRKELADSGRAIRGLVLSRLD